MALLSNFKNWNLTTHGIYLIINVNAGFVHLNAEFRLMWYENIIHACVATSFRTKILNVIVTELYLRKTCDAYIFAIKFHWQTLVMQYYSIALELWVRVIGLLEY